MHIPEKNGILFDSQESCTLCNNKCNMVTIKKIEIKNFFGKGDFCWELDSCVNILGGKNGSGKSTILKYCYAMMTNEKVCHDMDVQLSKIADAFVITFSNGWSINWSKNDFPILVETPGAFTFNNYTIVTDEKGNVHKFDELYSQYKTDFISTFEQYISSFKSNEQPGGNTQQKDAMLLDLLIKEQINVRNNDFREFMENHIGDSETDNEARNTYMTEYRKVYATLESFLTNYDDKVSGNFEFKRNGQSFSYEYLSMGEKQILLLLLMIANMKGEPCIFFMDEPDLSMHIDWKEQLVSRIHALNPNMQIILTTHAPSVITGWFDHVHEVGELTK